MAFVIISSTFKRTFSTNSSKMIAYPWLMHMFQGSLRNAMSLSSSLLTPCTCACFNHRGFPRLINTGRGVKSTPFLNITQVYPVHKNYLYTSQCNRELSKSDGNEGAREAPRGSAKINKKTVTTKQISIFGPSSKSDLPMKTKTPGSISSPSSLLVDPLDSKSLVGKLQFDPKDWKTVYRFRHMGAARAVQKLKIYQTIFTTFIALPVTFGLSLFGIIPSGYVTFMLAMSIVACTMLYIMGTFCARLIGFIYVSKSDPTMVRVAHLNFWGKRVDELFKKTDFVPFSELPDNVLDAYVNVKLYLDPDATMHICLRYGGQVFDKLEFVDIFGDHCGISISDEEMKRKDES